MDAYMGMVALFPATSYWREGVVGWMPCRGQLLAINQNQALFALIGTEFGGNGQTTFALPNLSDKAPKGLQYLICVQGIFPSRPD